MIENERQFETFVRRLKLNDAPDHRHRDKLEQELLAALAQTPRHRQPRLKIWRLIMQKTPKRLAAAALLVAVFTGFVLLDKDRVVFGKITGTAKTGLTHLKEIVSEIKKKKISEPKEEKPAGKLIPAKPADQNEASKADEDLRNKPTVSANIQICTVEAKFRKKLQGFFEKQTIQFTQIEADPNLPSERPAFWANLDPNKTESFLQFAKSSPEIHILVAPQLELLDGIEGIIYTGSTEEGLAVSLLPTVLDNEGHIGLTFGFLLDAGKDRQSGFEISNISTASGETLLAQTTMLLPQKRSFLSRIFRSRKEETLLILLRLKVIPPNTNR